MKLTRSLAEVFQVGDRMGQPIQKDQQAPNRLGTVRGGLQCLKCFQAGKTRRQAVLGQSHNQHTPPVGCKRASPQQKIQGWILTQPTQFPLQQTRVKTAVMDHQSITVYKPMPGPRPDDDHVPPTQFTLPTGREVPAAPLPCQGDFHKIVPVRFITTPQFHPVHHRRGMVGGEKAFS